MNQHLPIDNTNTLCQYMIMLSKKLSKRELKEDTNITIGRLRTRVRDYAKDERALALLEKISDEYMALELKAFRLERDAEELEDEPIQIPGFEGVKESLDKLTILK